MTQSVVEEIQLDIQEAREVMAQGERLNRLFNNRDFQAVILEGFFKEEAYRLVELKAAPQMQGEQQQAAIMQAIDAIGGLQQHFNKIRVMAEQARMAIEAGEQQLQELAIEGEV